MSKVKYYYDPDTLSYRKIEPNQRRKIRNIILFFSPLPVVFLVGIYLGNYYKVPVIDKDIPVSKNRLVELSTMIKEVDSIISGVQTHIDLQESFLINQSRVIEFRQRKSQEKLESTEKTQYHISNDINSMKDKISELQIERDSLQMANEIDFDLLAIYERQIRWEKIITGITQNIFFFFLGVLINYLINRIFKRKILKEAMNRAEFDKDAYDIKLDNSKREKVDLTNKYSSKIAILITEKAKGEEKFKNIITEKNHIISKMNNEIYELQNLVKNLSQDNH